MSLSCTEVNEFCHKIHGLWPVVFQLYMKVFHTSQCCYLCLFFIFYVDKEPFFNSFEHI